jgi:hypothetical protein
MNIDLKNELTIGKSFSICVPDGYESSVLDGGETFQLTIQPGFEPLYVKRYQSALNLNDRDLQVQLDATTARFIKDAIAPVLKTEPKFSIQAGRVDKMKYAQGVVQVEHDSWWICRVIGKSEYPYYYLIHWIGKKSEVSIGIAVIASFTINEVER